MNRSTYYYETRGESPENLELMRRIDEQYLQTPFYGSRKMAAWLREQKPLSLAAADGRVRLNTATQAELESVSGIGPVLAARIIAARDERGGFTVVEDLLVATALRAPFGAGGAGAELLEGGFDRGEVGRAGRQDQHIGHG